MSVYSNIDQALNELKNIYLENKMKTLRVGTGEVIDSLALDPLTLYSKDLIGLFSEFNKNWKLELKTKSNYVDHLLDVPHNENIIFSWSINPQQVIDTDEAKTASLKERLDAAKKCLNKGFKVAFHMDPLIYHKGWEESYFDLVDTLTKEFRPEDLLNISLGALRFQPEQSFMVQQRFDKNSKVKQAELFTGVDGKLRYDQRLRNHMFKKIINRFKSSSEAWKVYLCMETPESWLGTYGDNPLQQEELVDLFKPVRV